MVTARVIVGSAVGLHARPARLLVDEVARHPVPIRIGRSEDKLVNAASILAVMALGVKGGEEVIVTADGAGAEPALAAITGLLERDLDS